MSHWRDLVALVQAVVIVIVMVIVIVQSLVMLLRIIPDPVWMLEAIVMIFSILRYVSRMMVPLNVLVIILNVQVIIRTIMRYSVYIL